MAHHVAYRDYEIIPNPYCADDGRWYGGYQITKDGTAIRNRTHVFPGFLYREPAIVDSIEHAKIEIDNLIAIQGAS